MNKTEFVKRVRQLIAEGNIEIALTFVGQNISEFGISFLNDVIMLSNQFNSVKHDFLIGGFLNRSDFDQTIARISYALLNIIDKVSEITASENIRRNGQILHKIPSEMSILKESKCIVRIAYTTEILIKNMEVDNDTEIDSIQITDLMSVELLDTNDIETFKIRTCTDEEQFVIYEDFTQWIFFVRPIRAGKHPLYLKLVVSEIINGKERKRNIVLEKEIAIIQNDVQIIDDDFDNTNFLLVGKKIETRAKRKQIIGYSSVGIVLIFFSFCIYLIMPTGSGSEYPPNIKEITYNDTLIPPNIKEIAYTDTSIRPNMELRDLDSLRKKATHYSNSKDIVVTNKKIKYSKKPEPSIRDVRINDSLTALSVPKENLLVMIDTSEKATQLNAMENSGRVIDITASSPKNDTFNWLWGVIICAGFVTLILWLNKLRK